MGKMSIKIAGAGLFALAIIYGASAFNGEDASGENINEEPVISQEGTNQEIISQKTISASQIIEDANERRRIELDKKSAEAQLESQRVKKAQTPECKFWTLQKQKGTSDKADEKIAQFCVL